MSACAAALLGDRARGRVGVLMYHRVTEHVPGACAPTWNVTPERFRRQVGGLLARGFEPWPLRRVIEAGRRGHPIPARVFVVTFDDGYESVYRNAWPILRELGVPATIFLPTAYIGQASSFPFDDWREAGSGDVPPHAWRLMSMAQCLELAAESLVELGAHTHTHNDFRGRPGEFASDLARCVDFMRAHFGLAEVTFAFPFGYAEPALVDAARRSGVVCGLSTREELADPTADPFGWGRFEVGQADSVSTIAACLSGWYNVIRGARPRLGLKPAPTRVETTIGDNPPVS